MVLSGFVAGLPTDSQSALQSLLRTVHHERGTRLFAYSEQIEHVWFPHTGTVVSLLIPLLDGQNIETGLVGHMGLVGGSAALGGRTALSTAVVQNGDALSRAPLDRFRELMEFDAALRRRVQNHEQFAYVQAPRRATPSTMLNLGFVVGSFKLGTWLRATRWVSHKNLLATSLVSGARP